MKKTILLILTVALCVFALAACQTETNTDLNPYQDAVAKTFPSSVRVETSYTDNAYGVELCGVYTVTYNADGTAVVEYEYDKLNPAGSAELYDKVSGTVTIAADGTVSGSLDANVTAAAKVSLNLDTEKMTYSVDKGILTAQISAANTKSVLGVDLGADAKLDMRLAGEAIGSYTVNYTTAKGAAKIVCIYS